MPGVDVMLFCSVHQHYF